MFIVIYLIILYYLNQCSGIAITNVTAFVNEAHFKDSARLIRVLQSHRPEKTGRCYLVKGTCDQIDDLAVQLSAALKRESGPDSGPSDHQQTEDSSLHVSCVCVSASSSGLLNWNYGLSFPLELLQHLFIQKRCLSGRNFSIVDQCL